MTLNPIDLEYLVGDATFPKAEGPKVICHCCNDIGAWGSGFVVALSKRWRAPEAQYRKWAAGLLTDDVPFELGQALFVKVSKDVWVSNILGQHKTIAQGERAPIRYDALAQGLWKTGNFCRQLGATAHMPRLGAGLARGDWNKIEKIILSSVVHRGTHVKVYDL